MCTVLYSEAERIRAQNEGLFPGFFSHSRGRSLWTALLDNFRRWASTIDTGRRGLVVEPQYLKGIEKSSVSPHKRVIQFNVGENGVCAKLGWMEKNTDGVIEWVEEEPTKCAQWTKQDEEACRSQLDTVRSASRTTTPRSIMPRPETDCELPSSFQSPSSSAFTVPSSIDVQDTLYPMTTRILAAWTPDPNDEVATKAKEAWDRRSYL